MWVELSNCVWALLWSVFATDSGEGMNLAAYLKYLNVLLFPCSFSVCESNKLCSEVCRRLDIKHVLPEI